jgi:tripartite-type tricarboxylate transporter receptor subunit TctC
VPTCREKGYNVERVTYFVLAAKKGTPKPILDTLVKLFTQTSNDPGVQASLARAGFVPRPTNPEEPEKNIIGDYEMAHDVFEKLGLGGK